MEAPLNVVAYSFFRNDHSGYESERCGEARGRVFVNYLPALIRAHHHVWTGWELRIYHDDRVRDFPYFKALEWMDSSGLLRLIPFGESKTLCGLGGMMERLRPLFDQDVEYLVCRDIDSLPMPRDRRMVEEFIELHGTVHTIHDSVSHSGMMGGTCAFDVGKFRQRFEAKSLEQLMARVDGIDYNQHGADQQFLNQYVWPNICTQGIIHAKADKGEICFKRLPVASQTCDEDRLFNHIGGCGDAEAAKRFYDQRYPNAMILGCEAS